MNNTNFITAAVTNQRLAQQHKEFMLKAIDTVNRIIKEATCFPVIIPKTVFGEIAVVRQELLRKLREESGWEIEGGGESIFGQGYDVLRTSGDDFVYLYNPPVRREELKQK